MKQVTLLGATGSIGSSTLDVIRRHSDMFRLHGAAASKSVDKMVEIVREFHPARVAMSDEASAVKLIEKLKEQNLFTDVLVGDDGVEALAGDGGADIVVGAIVGAAGLRPVMAAVKTGCIIALANKEALVMSGRIFFDEVHKCHAKVLPVDSEHSAIFQCLPYDAQSSLGYCSLAKNGVSKILLTGSGGPFRNIPLEDLKDVTAEQAVAHPVWSMGPKISVDSATMMNKGLEFIEARYLFNASDDEIKVVIHPQSVVHSMVAYNDGAILAQMGRPDMRTPIAVAMAFPQRIESGVEPLDFENVGELSFLKPDYDRYPCLKLAMQASRSGQFATTVLNASNEIAVDSFLKGEIGFTGIASVVEEVLNRLNGQEPTDIDSVFAADTLARETARDVLGELNG